MTIIANHGHLCCAPAAVRLPASSQRVRRRPSKAQLIARAACLQAIPGDRAASEAIESPFTS